MQRRQIQHAGAALLFFTAIFTAPPASAEIEFTTLALEGDSAPGLAAPFTSFTAPLLAGSRFAFGGTSGVPGSSINPLRTGLFAGRAGLYNAVLLDTDEAPGAPGTRFRFTRTGFSPTAVSQINATGALAFTGELTGAGVNSTQSDTLNQRGVWSTTFDDLALEMRANNPVPAFGDGWRFSLPGPVALNANNNIAFWATVKRGSFPATETKTGLFSRESGLVEFNVLFDDTMVIPGLPTTFQQAQPAPSGQVIDLPAPAFNKLGSALVMIDFANPAYHFGGRAEALLVASPQGLQVVAHTASNPFDVPVPTGNVAPGLPGTVFRNLFVSRLNDLGDVALMAETQSAPGTVGVFGIGVWAGAPGQLQLIAREGQTVAAGVRIMEDPVFAPLKLLQFNDPGQVAMFSELAVDGEDPSGIITGLLRGDATALELIARSGAGGAFEGAEFTSFDDVALNNRGQLAFLAGRRDTLLSETFTALMLSDLDGLRTLVRTGTDIEVRPGDLRNVQAIDVSSRYLGDNGDYAYKLQFTDGKSGIFLAQAGTVRGTDFFLRNAGPDVVDWLDAQWKDSLDFDTSEPGFLGNEIVTIENSHVEIIDAAGAYTLTIGRMNSTGSLELGEVLEGGPSLILNSTDDGDSNIQSLILRGGELRARHDVLLSGNSQFISGDLSAGDNITITNSADLLVKEVGAAGNGLLVNASAGRMVFGSDAFMALSDGMKLINLGKIEVSAGDIEAATFLDETVRNEGRFIKHADTSAPQDIFSITAGFENAGVLDFEGGELDLAPIVSSGQHLAGARYTLSSSEGTTPSILRFRGAHTITGDVSIESTPSGRWILDGATLDLSQAELNANVDTIWRGATVYAGGTLTGDFPQRGLQINAGRTLRLEQSEVFGKTSRLAGISSVDGAVVQKDADLLLDQATVTLTEGAVDSVWVLEGDADVLTDRKSDFINRSGTLSKRGGGASRFEAFYTGGSGEIRVTEGSLTFAGGGEFKGRITLDETAGGASTVRLVDDTNSPQFTAAALLFVIGEGGGEFSIENGAELRVNEDSAVIFDVAGRGVQLAGGTLSGFSPAPLGGFNNRGHMHWTSGVIGVPGLGEKSAELFK